MASIARIPITNVFMGGDYTGVIQVGPGQKPMNVILDTGSSALALDGKKYQPDLAGGDQTTNLAQTDSYGDGSSWTGAVIKSTVRIGAGNTSISLPNANVSVAYERSDDMFNGSDGILGLAYAPLDDAFSMASDTWNTKYSSNDVRTGRQSDIAPYLTQLEDVGVASDKIAFVTRRSFIHVGNSDPAADPLNQGVMIVGGGEEATDLYTGPFQFVKVLSDDWYSTNLRHVVVGTTDPIAARLKGPKGMPSNSIIDSGTNSLNLSPQLLRAVISKFSASQQSLLKKSIHGGNLVDASELNLADWPTITFVLQGETGDVSLNVAPTDYWQVNTQDAGAAAAAITEGQPGQAILGLPIMNGYFVIFDGEADGGKGSVMFAARAH